MAFARSVVAAGLSVLLMGQALPPTAISADAASGKTDPTSLTTQLTFREIAALKELIQTKLDAVVTRLDAADKAVTLLHADVTRVPTDVDKSIAHLKELTFQKLAADYEGVALQFKERDTRVEQTAKDSKVAVDAALSAAKEAVGEQNKSSALAIAKQEATFTKQIDQLSVLLSTVTKGQEDKINDMKSRLDSVDGRSRGVGDSWGIIVVGAGLLIGGAGLLVAFNRRTEVVAQVTPPAGPMVAPAGYVLVPTTQTKAS